MNDYESANTVFSFMFKPTLTQQEIAWVRLIASMGLVVHPAVYKRIHEILDET